MLDAIYPRMLGVRQRFSIPSPVDLAPALDRQWNVIADRVPSGARIAVAVGSRGITNLAAIVAQVISKLKAAGAQPFIIPAMGSHGGATPEGQTEILAEYGVTAARLGVPIEATMEVERVGATEDGVEVFVSVAALRADGVIIINRIKPHTDFSGALGSGVMKMMVIGLGKRHGAATFHAAACRLGYEHVIRTVARVIMRRAPVLGGIAIIENQVHQTSGIHLLPPENIEAGENELFLEARRLMPRLPLEEIDFLIVDQLGKNISGAGMDPNIIGRSVHGYSSFLGQKNMPPPFIRRIFVRDMTAETHGNGIGIGLADVTTDRFVRGLDRKAMYINALTSLTPQGAKLPVHFATDKEAIGQVLNSLGLSDPTTAIVVRIRDTLTLDELEISESAQELVGRNEALRIVRPAAPMEFDATGNLAPLCAPAGRED